MGQVPGNKRGRIGGEMREKEIEKYLADLVTAQGGMALKFVSPGCTGVPDRVVILPGGKIGFLELKAPGGKPRKEQAYRIRQLRELGCRAGFADSREDINRFLYSMATGIPVREGMSGPQETEGER